MTPSEQHYEAAYTDLFINDPEYAYSASRTNPRALASVMTLSLAAGSGNKDGTGIKRACKAVGIKHTYTAIRGYLK